MDISKFLSALSGLIFLVAYVPYVRSILKGKTKPMKASWIIWGSLDTITIAGMYFKDSLNGQIIGAIIGAWSVIILSLKYGSPGWTLLDKLCLAGAALGVILWKTFDDPVFGIVTSQIVIFLGSTPTFVSAWQDPSRENASAWILYWVSCLVALLALPAWTFEDAAQPICFTAIESIMMFILFIKPRFEKLEKGGDVEVLVRKGHSS